MIDDLVLDAMAVHRLSRLVTTDALTQPLRDRVIAWSYDRDQRAQARADLSEARYNRRHGNCGALQDLAHDDECPPRAAKLVTCVFCASVWVGFGVVVARRVAPRWWAPVATALAWSSATILAAKWEVDQ